LFSKPFLPWRNRALVCLVLSGATSAFAQTALQVAPSAPAPAGVTLRQALDAAWELTPQARAASSRLATLRARESAAQSFMAGAPSATVSQRSDRAGSNAGMREYEAGIALPLWSPGVRKATQGEVGADRDAFDALQTLARLQLAAQVRAHAADLALAQAEATLGARKRDEAGRLLDDVERRVKAGDAARVDALHAQSAVRQAEAVATLADAAVARARAEWASLTGLAAQPMLEVPPAAANATERASLHPAVQAAQAQTSLAQARLALAEADRRDPMELDVGVVRERAVFGAAGETSLRIALRIPFSTENRNAPRIAAARAELDAAHAESDTLRRQLQAEEATARAMLASATTTQALAEKRAVLAAEIRALMAKAYRLGEGDLPTLLRAENEKSDADLALARARIEAHRAASQLNQALGFLP
jgi:cobalt-zinc-cadmium efflux system outer membrane protein